MITTTVSLAMHLIYSSYQGVRAAARVFGYILPHNYGTMAAIKDRIDFNTKHLKTGDPMPPFTGKLRVYNMRFCPFAQRTILALNAKNLDYEVVNIDLIDKPEWLTSKSAFGKVPAVEVKEGDVVYESLITVEYLDDLFPERPLLPKDPLKKAQDKIIVEAATPIHTIFIKSVKGPDSITEDNIKAFNNALLFIENQLKTRGTKFLDGSEPGYADYMIWPWFERLPIVESVVKVDEKKYPLLTQYLQYMKQDPAVEAYLVSIENHIKILNAYKYGGKPEYDLLRK